MFKNYLKIAFRNLWKHKSFTLINITGMGIAFTATILLAMTAMNELTFDSFNKNKNSLYQLYIETHRPNNTETNSTMPVPLTPALKAEFPDIVHISRYGSIGGSTIRYNGKEFSKLIRTTDADFLRMFTYPLISGNKETALNNKSDIVISQKSAEAIFGKEYPVGKTLNIKIHDEWKDYTVSGVMEDAPLNSSITFDMITRFENFPNYEPYADNWSSSTHDVYIQLNTGVTQAAFEKKLINFIHKYYKDDLEQLKKDGGRPDADGELLRLKLIPITDLHFSPILNTGGVSRFYAYLLLLIGAFILFIASVNFVNLSLGRTFTRAREIGMRKVMGAGRRQILLQFWGESFVICLFSLLMGMLLARLLLPYYKTNFYQAFSTDILRSPQLIIIFAAGFLLVSILAGGYPAWIMSALNTSQTVKGKITTGKNHRLRNSLMVVQFVLSGLLIICTSIVWQQLNYMRTKPLGYNKEQIISIPIGNNIGQERALELMRVQLAKVPNVLSVTGTDINLGRGRDGSTSNSVIGFQYKGKTVKTNWLRVDYDYISTLGLTLLQGRDFSRDFGTDSGVVIINEAMAAEIGEKNPLDANLDLDGSHLQVAGVVKNYHFKSLHKEITPLTMCIRKNWTLSYIFVKVKPENLPASMDAVNKVWHTVNPKAESQISFLDENTEKQYRKEERISKIFISGAVLAILISCMGLFAIVVLVIMQRTKEIGIRKVLGASVLNITTLISKDFIGLILIALTIATPIAWWAMNKWLQDFAYRIHISAWIFLLAGGIALLIALVTICIQTIRAAIANPVKSLKSE
ncbi:ABC transporter permease [Sediminibacterium ginsengisoli]|uniref:ABC-type transport system, involved in lipoprotein release, permease component n=1 Tax=Sediminibacterium ginsengisoli TaxID=413434 RepID=A0A1T4PID5_9BACT|nr:ABC transporter permease [Sediminibacterium ginsengisoli]SJZ91320.1 ABC-type transport system, involved in lipoprotein release, permease component [Sediminibacterium ginsengisoli]